MSDLPETTTDPKVIDLDEKVIDLDDDWLNDIDLTASPAKKPKRVKKNKRFTERDYIPPQRYVAKRGPDVQRPVIEILGQFEDSADVATVKLPSRHLNRLRKIVEISLAYGTYSVDAEIDRIASILRVAADQLAAKPAPVARPSHQLDLFIPFVDPKDFKR